MKLVGKFIGITPTVSSPPTPPEQNSYFPVCLLQKEEKTKHLTIHIWLTPKEKKKAKPQKNP